MVKWVLKIVFSVRHVSEIHDTADYDEVQKVAYLSTFSPDAQVF